MDTGIALTVGTVGVPDGGAGPSASGANGPGTHGLPARDAGDDTTGSSVDDAGSGPVDDAGSGPVDDAGSGPVDDAGSGLVDDAGSGPVDDASGGPVRDIAGGPGGVTARPPDGGHGSVPAPGEVALVRLTGRLGPGEAHDLAVALAAVLAERPRVVADVSGVELGHSAAVHAFTDAQDRAGGWPWARLVLAAPGPLLASLLASSRVARRVPVHPDVATAVARVDVRPASVRAYWSFGVDPHAPGTARGHLRQVCAAWDVDDEAREAAEIVVTELVTNAVEHASSATVVAVERLAGSFRLAVRDFDTRTLPEVVLPAPTSARGRGLAMVAAVSREWGVHTHADGKTVWSEMGA